jgi:hypothetical protein
MAIIEQLTGSGCQMRSVNIFDIDSTVEFAIVIHGVSPIAAIGTVKTRSQNGARFIYHVVLDTTPEISAAIERAVDVARARAFSRDAASSVTPAARMHAASPPPSGLTRLSVRVIVDFEVGFSVNGSGSFMGRATNISAGGMLMTTAQEMPVGAGLDLRFILGDEPMSVKGRIVAHPEKTNNYNIAFFEMRDSAKQTLARFIKEREGT